NFSFPSASKWRTCNSSQTQSVCKSRNEGCACICQCGLSRRRKQRDGATPQNRMKPTLDKDLDKLTLVEDASYHMTRGMTAPGLGLLFLMISALVASVYVIGQPSA